MNAYELADELDKYKGIATRDAATMLRKLQDELSDLQRHIPVKELTDEDLEAIYQTMTGIEVNYYEYARACIRKAQE